VPLLMNMLVSLRLLSILSVDFKKESCLDGFYLVRTS
jgi:hypothetical protein